MLNGRRPGAAVTADVRDPSRWTEWVLPVLTPFEGKEVRRSFFMMSNFSAALEKAN
jgi:hypothetical protein